MGETPLLGKCGTRCEDGAHVRRASPGNGKAQVPPLRQKAGGAFLTFVLQLEQGEGPGFQIVLFPALQDREPLFVGRIGGGVQHDLPTDAPLVIVRRIKLERR